MPLLPDPDKVRIRVYQTNSTHKSMSALRQGSMILVWDEDFHHVEGPFEEAFLAHTSTSPNLQIIASLDVARRQMELEGYELTMRADRARAADPAGGEHASAHPQVLPHRDPRGHDPGGVPRVRRRRTTAVRIRPGRRCVDAWDGDEFALDPTRLTMICGAAGFDGTQFKGLLAERFDVQLNKTSRNSVLVQTNINNTRSDAALLIKVLADLAREIDAAPRPGRRRRAGGLRRRG